MHDFFSLQIDSDQDLVGDACDTNDDRYSSPLELFVLLYSNTKKRSVQLHSIHNIMYIMSN